VSEHREQFDATYPYRSQSRRAGATVFCHRTAEEAEEWAKRLTELEGCGATVNAVDGPLHIDVRPA
jgi:hypothetical protein